MAIAKLLPRKISPGRTRLQTMEQRLGYDRNPDKTRDGELVSSYMCSPETAAQEFEASKLLYEAQTGRRKAEGEEVIMYRIIQSFKPGEVTPEEANKIGFELAKEFTKGRHQFVVYTHEDKAHIHNHIEINSTNLNCDGKFRNVKDSVEVLRRINDKLCLSHGLSTPEPKRQKAMTDKEAGAYRYGNSFKEKLRILIDRLIPLCNTFDEFLAKMRQEGYEVKHRGKSLEFRAPDQQRFTRSQRLGEAYTEEALRERIEGRKERTAEEKSEDRRGGENTRQPAQNAAPKADTQNAHKQNKTTDNTQRADSSRNQRTDSNTERRNTQSTNGKTNQSSNQNNSENTTRQSAQSTNQNSGRNAARNTTQKKPHTPPQRNVNLLVDIQAKLAAGKGKGYERWAKVFNLKEASKTINFLTENGVETYEDLAARAEEYGRKFDSLSARMKQLEGRMAGVKDMKTHIINYAKTKDIYTEYKRSRNRQEFYAEHAEEIQKHEAAKAAFNELKGKPIPKVAQLNEEYKKLLAEKQKCYEEYKQARQDMIDYQNALQNVERILGMERTARDQQRAKQTDKTQH